MADYISREAAFAVIEEKQKELCPAGLWGRKFASDKDKYDAWQEILEELEAIPAADVEPVRHGKWGRIGDSWDNRSHFQCSVCGDEWCFEIDEDSQMLMNHNYCPNCGAKMDLEG